MAQTRTQTRTIEMQNSDYETLKLGGESSRTKSSNLGGSFESDVSSASRRRGSPGRSSIRKRLCRQRFKYKRPEPILKEALREPVTGFWPSVAIGGDHGPMSEVQRISKEIEDWETIQREHEENHPLAVPQIKMYLEGLRKRKSKIEHYESAHQVIDNEGRLEVVQKRISILRAALKTSKPSAERENIQGAIAAYESGEIGYSRKYTLFWGGKVVDVCDTYPEFTVDRMERLDRYSRDYGTHWLWYESPLAVSPETGGQLMRYGVALRIPHCAGSGHFDIEMGFQKQIGLVTRSPEYLPLIRHPVDEATNALTEADGRVWCIGDGPKLVFRTMLDSGASVPVLYRADLERLGVHPDNYPAQTIQVFETANGPTQTRSYDLQVDVLDHQKRSLVDENDPIHPQFPLRCGAMQPVAMFMNGAVYDQEVGPDGQTNGSGGRLSGNLPFTAAYVSSTPGNNVLLFGEDRNDVLGFAKMPPARRWEFGGPQESRGGALRDIYGNPLITFSHLGGKFVDQDAQKGVAVATVHPGTDKEHREISDPGNRLKQQDASYISPQTIVEQSERVDWAELEKWTQT